MTAMPAGAVCKWQVPSGAAAGQQLRIAEETPKDAVGEASGRSEDDTEGVGGAPSDSEADLAMGADERWVRDAAESMALEKLRGVLGEAARCSDEMQSLAQSIGSEARCFLRYLRLHSVRLIAQHCCAVLARGCRLTCRCSST
eukprot:COSAG03_NODE_3667_length_1889_cov_1.699441_2_plen_143_part_00